jgi:hypothetical protein
MSDDFSAADAARCRARRLARLARHGHVRNDGSTVTIALAEDLLEPLAAYAKDHGQSSEEAIAALVRMGLLGDDARESGEIGEDDPDNQGGNDSNRMKEHESIRETRSASVQRQMECEAEVQTLIAQGRFAEARRVEKLYGAYDRHVTPKVTDDEQRSALVDAIVRAGTAEMNRRRH